MAEWRCQRGARLSSMARYAHNRAADLEAESRRAEQAARGPQSLAEAYFNAYRDGLMDPRDMPEYIRHALGL